MVLFFMIFKDKIKVFVKSGKGGDGIYSMNRSKLNPRGIPDGGNGGKGGSVWIYASKSYSHLGHLTKFHFVAEDGKNGESQCKNGARGKNIEIYVPPYTTIIDLNTDKELKELKDGDKFCIAKGGSGGLGNKYYVSSTKLSAEKFTLGKPPVEKYIVLQMRLIADIGIIGAPNAGKSSLLRALTNSKTQVGDYAFTTLIPHLGISDRGFSLIDLPGLIEGASYGKGMGIQFLQHIEKCQILICILDIIEEPQKTYQMLINELAAYNPDLIRKVKLIILNKLDLINKDNIPIIDEKVEQICVSAVSAYNINLLHQTLSKLRDTISSSENDSL